jgi:tetratricopeptide (TPR) repeat protein
LEQRILELEASSKPPHFLPESVSTNGDSNGSPKEPPLGEMSHPTGPDKLDLVCLLLGKSQTLLKLDQPEAALGCLDEILALEPAHAEALIKKGSALERLQRFDEAIQCYDRAIAQDDSLTMAYLCKGGVFNRVGRFAEALECYEQALQRPGKATK